MPMKYFVWMTVKLYIQRYLSMTIMHFHRHGNVLWLQGIKSKYESTLSAIVFGIFPIGDGSLIYYLMSAKLVNNVLESLMVSLMAYAET